jgi:uncharacterized membrane protein YvbJ
MDSKSLTLLVGFILIIFMIFLLISYSYYPIGDSNSVNVNMNAIEAQNTATKISSKKHLKVDVKEAQILASQLRKDKDVWAQWTEKLNIDKSS